MQFDPVQRAQVYTTLAQAAASLFSLYLKAKGVDPADHPFNKEHDRLKQYNKKVRKIAAVEELNRNRPTLEVDVAAMSRFIAAAVPDLNAAQREELKQVGKKDKAQREQEREERAAAKRRKKSGGGGNNANSSDAALAFLHETLGEVKPSKTPSGK